MKKEIRFINENTNEAKYYGRKEWRQLRNRIIRENPLCYDCYNKGIIKAAEEVHHVKPFMKTQSERLRLELLLDEDNLVCLCKECHKKRHGKKPNINLDDY